MPTCDVLFIYSRLSASGLLQGTSDSLRRLVGKSGCKVAVLAMDNDGPGCVAALKQAGPKTANLVITVERKGELFPRFFDQLFARMKSGVAMPVAWNQLAPQIPGAEHESAPGTFAAMEAGAVRFR